MNVRLIGKIATACLAASVALAEAVPERGPAKPAVAVHGVSPAYYGEIRPIVHRHCVSCHRDGVTAAPFPLTRYRDVERRASQIAELVTSGAMPPWKPASHGELLDENRLSPEEVAAIRQWADLKAPAGQGIDPAVPAREAAGDLGVPDAVLSPASPVKIAADTPDFYQCFVLPTNFAADKYLSALVFQPGNPRTDNQALEYIDVHRQVRFQNAVAPRGGFTVRRSTCGLSPSAIAGGWGIPTGPRRFPAGTGVLLPRGADIVLQVRYRCTGKAETDLPRVLLYFCKEPVEREVRVAPILTSRLRFGGRMRMAYTNFVGQSPVVSDISVLGVMPYMRSQGRAIKLDILARDKSLRNLFSIEDWNFDWLGDYRFKKPVRISKGGLLVMTASMGGTHAGEPAARDAHVTTWGDTLNDENAVAYVFYTTDRENLRSRHKEAGIPPLGGANDAAVTRIMLGMFDANGDGRIDPPERHTIYQIFGPDIPVMPKMDAM